MHPGMFFGGTDSRAMLMALTYTVAASLDAGVSGQCKSILVLLHKGNTFTVQDDGPGLAVADIEEMPSSFWMRCCRWPLVCKVSSDGTAEVRRDGYLWQQSYKTGQPTGPVKQVRALHAGEATGNTFTFTLDPAIFDADASIPYPYVYVILRDLAYQLPELHITLRDERNDPATEMVFHYENGLADYVRFLNRDCKSLHDVFHGSEEVEFRPAGREPYTVHVDFAIQFTDCTQPLILSYLNLQELRAGGDHLHYLRRGVWAALDQRNGLQAAEQPPTDFFAGMTAVVSAYHPDPIYYDNRRTDIAEPDLSVTYPIVYRHVGDYFWHNMDVRQRVLERQPVRDLSDDARRYGPFAGQIDRQSMPFWW
jgi:DNA gyrase subunit B